MYISIQYFKSIIKQLCLGEIFYNSPNFFNMTKLQKEKLFNKELYIHNQALLIFAKKLTSNEDDANDLLQETYIKAFRFLNTYEPGSNGKAWLHRIMKNTFINDFRRDSKKPVTLDINDMANQVEDTSLDVKNILSMNDCLEDEILLALVSLADDYAAILYICDILEFSYQDISYIFDIPIGTVRSRLFRARNELKDKLEHLATDRGYKINRK